MISNLSIRNFALIENCELNLSENLNIISGETGSGKSIIIQALAILLGDRASIDQIRSGVDEAVLTAVITIDNNRYIYKYLDNLGISIENDELIIRRHLFINGKSRSFINSTQVTSKELSYISSILFDFHGQHDGISLLRKETHIRYLDGFLKNESKIQKIQDLFSVLNTIRKELEALKQNQTDKEKKIELLTYEVDEIEKASVKNGEDTSLDEQIKIYTNLEKIILFSNEAENIFSCEGGIISSIKKTRQLTQQLSELDKTFTQSENDLADIFYKLEDIYQNLSEKISKYVYNQNELDQLMERSAIYDKLKRKYGGTTETILQHLSKIKKELSDMENQDERINQLSGEYKKVLSEYVNLSKEISAYRKINKTNLETAITTELTDLGMSNPIFEVQINSEADENSPVIIDGIPVKYSMYGIDRVEFLISPNKGELPKPLSKIASGGELSRIILALKSILGKNDSVRTMIFDEIDVGIGGKVALSVSSKIKKIAGEKQIICITHLPQIAANGSRNFNIIKETINERTVTKITQLDDSAKINEVARMLSGTITDKSLNHAQELINSLSNSI